MKTCSTWCQLGNGDYPRLQIIWTLDDDEHGYTGTAQAWKDGNTTEGRAHTVWVRLGSPLGYGLHLFFDPHQVGAWASVNVRGYNRLDGETLNFVNAWACEAYKGLKSSMPEAA